MQPIDRRTFLGSLAGSILLGVRVHADGFRHQTLCRNSESSSAPSRSSRRLLAGRSRPLRHLQRKILESATAVCS